MPIPATRGLHQRSLLRENVYHTLRDAIIRGDLEPGEKLRDSELGQWLGVSRTPIREALLRLEQSGLVISTPGKLTMVAPENDDAVRHAQQVAAQLHALAITLAAPRLTAEDLAEMERANQILATSLAKIPASSESASTTDREQAADMAQEAIAADDAFHNVAVHASGNPLIPEHLESVTAALRRREYLHFGSLTGSDSPTQHARIIQALRDGHTSAAAELTRQNWLRLIDSAAE
ncbi:GntR family transcriptional regulator [Kocuria sp.]|uniref:GntR family transcriptional regulator n=1 Tax=Kocuria sp. TaxID=1871328 RepID=UPI0026DFCB42|nr:GntR family transcriptional regulator [Kocuria sp.]MDO5617305.1 GntR family transcriptional regulator [Kocuria sp.]